jgi:T6SS, Phospholipase effector Tle1-like, catalytic domain
MRATCSGSARSPRAARLASSATQRASAASTPPGLTKRTSYTPAARGIRAPTGPLVPRCVLPPDTHPVHPRLGQGRALGIPTSGPHAVNLVNRWWQFHDTQLSSWVDAAFQDLAIDEERSSFRPTPWTRDPRADQHVEQVWFAGVHSDVGGGYPDPALAEIALLWMADRARECGLVLQADAFPASPENATQAPQDRMAPRRSQPLGTLRQSRTAWGLQLTPGPVMAGGRYGGRPGSDPAGNPPLSRCIRSPIRCSVSMRRKQAASWGSIRSAANDSGIRNPLQRDRANKPALVRSETSIGEVR